MGLTLAGFPDLTPAEQRLIGWLQARDRRACRISDSVPTTDTPDLRLRASLLRALALGQVQDVPLPETGLQVKGAWIAGDGPEGAETRGLDLEGCTVPGDLALFDCHLPDMVLLRSAKVRSVFLNRSELAQGLKADRLQAEGGVALRGVRAKGAVRLLGARLGGDLSCNGARFEVLKGVALRADGLQAGGNIGLDYVQAKGEVRLTGAQLRGNLSCVGARFTALAGGSALILDSVRITGALFLLEGAVVQGPLDLTAAEIGVICDDPDCWPATGNLILDRCRYGAFAGNSTPVDAPTRLRWLALQDPTKFRHDFWPQPYEECARVLREAGHSGAARAVLIEKERLQRAAKRERVRNRDLNFGLVNWAWRWVVDEVLLGATIRYGRRPMQAFYWLAGLWLLGALIFFQAEQVGALKPNLPQVQRAAEWVLCGADTGQPVAAQSFVGPRVGLRDGGETQYACFLRQPEAASYPRFSPLIYAADALFPVVSFEMQSYWLPDDQTPFGAWARRYLWLHIACGWGLTLLAVAGFSGLVKQDSK